ncbi:phage integrase domain protein SAM domain protein [Bacillus cereus]|nr:phage integrase domain protein SAM domain protein [Bacillus cereus]
MTWAFSVDVFLADLLKHGRKSSTVKQYATISPFLHYGFRNTSNYLQNRFFHSFDVNVLERYLKALKGTWECQFLISSVYEVF